MQRPAALGRPLSMTEGAGACTGMEHTPTARAHAARTGGRLPGGAGPRPRRTRKSWVDLLLDYKFSNVRLK